MTASHRRTHVVVLLLVALVLAATLVAACSAQASGGSLSSLTPSSSGQQAGGGNAGDGADGAATGGAARQTWSTSGSDWSRVMEALAWMQAEPPAKPFVVLLGGSAARECTIDDGSWRKQIQAKGGPATLAWNMGSRNRTMAQNLAIAKALPRGVKGIVLIGINLGSFTSAAKTATIKLPSPAPANQPSLQQPHPYSLSNRLSTAKKKALVGEWLGERYPVYKRNFTTSAGVLAKLIQTCKDRGYTPVLLELPRNTDVIGGALDAPTTKYRDKCRRLAAQYKIKWVSLLAKLPNADFYDLWHLVEPGRAIWQDRLSSKTASLLKLYGYDGGGS